MPEYLIPQTLAERIANYLAYRPWHEVKDLIPALLSLPKAPEKDSADAP